MQRKRHILARRKLEALRNAVGRELRSRGGVEIENPADPIDRVLASIDRDATLANLHRTAGQYKEIVHALNRIDAGEYGLCEDCDEAISSNRLKAVPWARRCIACQDARERQAA